MRNWKAFLVQPQTVLDLLSLASYQIPEDGKVVRVNIDVLKDNIILVVEHPSFPPSHEGEALEAVRL